MPVASHASDACCQHSAGRVTAFPRALHGRMALIARHALDVMNAVCMRHTCMAQQVAATLQHEVDLEVPG
eukprot:8208644-Lingulodinium_polyedra.AAC.1